MRCILLEGFKQDQILDGDCPVCAQDCCCIYQECKKDHLHHCFTYKRTRKRKKDAVDAGRPLKWMKIKQEDRRGVFKAEDKKTVKKEKKDECVPHIKFEASSPSSEEEDPDWQPVLKQEKKSKKTRSPSFFESENCFDEVHSEPAPRKKLKEEATPLTGHQDFKLCTSEPDSSNTNKETKNYRSAPITPSGDQEEPLLELREDLLNQEIWPPIALSSSNRKERAPWCEQTGSWVFPSSATVINAIIIDDESVICSLPPRRVWEDH